jgi:hypothetical protein
MQNVLNPSGQSTNRAGSEGRDPKVVRLNPRDESESRSILFPIVTLFVLAAWITASAVSDSLFLKEALVSSFIITCLLFHRGSARGKIPTRSSI